MYLIHQEKAEYNVGLRLIWFLPVALFIGAMISLYDQELEALWTLLGDSILVSAIFYFVFPRSYQIYNDRLRIVLGKPFSISIPFSGIKEAKRTAGYKAYVGFQARFATSSRYVIEIVKSRGASYTISPQHGELFLQQLEQAIKSRGF